MTYTFGPDASRFGRPEWAIDEDAEIDCCTWLHCRDTPILDTPLCWKHALEVYKIMHYTLTSAPVRRRIPLPSYVYYLMVGPETVKIGTTRNLLNRLRGLRTDSQYVVALERGDRELELKRHRQFRAERIGRREDFWLSKGLKSHIDSLLPERDRLMTLAMSENVL
jgi:hypothetical protein